MKRNVCSLILTCGGAPPRALNWGFFVGMRWLPTAVYGRPIDLTRDSFEDWEVEDRAPWPDDHSVLCW